MAKKKVEKVKKVKKTAKKKAADPNGWMQTYRHELRQTWRCREEQLPNDRLVELRVVFEATAEATLHAGEMGTVPVSLIDKGQIVAGRYNKQLLHLKLKTLLATAEELKAEMEG